MNGLASISPIETGLDALGVTMPEGILEQLGIKGVVEDDMVSQVCDRVERAITDHPEISSEIVVAGMYIILGEVDDMTIVNDVVLPRMDRAVDRALAA